MATILTPGFLSQIDFNAVSARIEKRLFTFSLSLNVIPKKLRESNKAVLLQKEIFDEEEQTRQGFVNGDISERKRGVGWGVDEVCTLALHTAHCSMNTCNAHCTLCTGSPVSMDGGVMDSVTSPP